MAELLKMMRTNSVFNEDKENDEIFINKPKRSWMKTCKMLMKIPKETNFSNKRSANYLGDWNEEVKECRYNESKYSTATPVCGKYIKQLQEYTWDPEEAIKMFENYDNTPREF